MSLLTIDVTTTSGSKDAILATVAGLVGNTTYNIKTAVTLPSTEHIDNNGGSLTYTWYSYYTFKTPATPVTAITLSANAVGTDTVTSAATITNYNTASVSLNAVVGTSASYCDTAKTPDLLSTKLSAPVITYNTMADTPLYVSGSTGVAQEFYLPDDYVRGDAIPSLTGLQAYVNVKDATKPIHYEIHSYDSSLNERPSPEISVTATSSEVVSSINYITYTTALSHGFKVGDTVTIIGFKPVGYNGRFTVTAVPSSKSFKIANPETGTVTVKGQLLPKVASNTLSYGGKVYYQIGQYNLSAQFVMDRPGKLKKTVHDKFRFVLTKPAKNIKKGSLVTFEVKSKDLKRDDKPVQDYRIELTKVVNCFFSKKTNPNFIIKDGTPTTLDVVDATVVEVYFNSSQKEYTFNNLHGYIDDIGVFHSREDTKKKKYSDFELKYASNLLDPKKSIMKVWSLKDPKKDPITKIKSSSTIATETVDEIYDSERGWTGSVRGTVSPGQITGDQWLDIKFKSIPLGLTDINQKFKLVIYGEGIDIYYNSVDLTSKTQAFQRNGSTPLSSGKSSILFKVMAGVADSGTDFLSNKYRSVAVKNTIDNIQNSESSFWSSKPNPSKFGIENLYFKLSDDTDQSVIIDSVFMDPITPGVSFNVYYSDEERKDLALAEADGTSYTYTTSDKHSFAVGDEVEIRSVTDIIFNGIFTITKIPASNQFTVTGLTSSTSSSKNGTYFKHLASENNKSWENLLWTWVPRNFKTNKKQSYVLPNPIKAKYIKIEFTNLQASYYNPGAHHVPVLYKKYPEWVINYFLSIYNINNDKTYDPIISSQVDIEYDAFSLAFNYYKGDILQPLANPVTIEDNNAQNNIITNLLKNASIDLAAYDYTSLRNINMTFDQFQKHPGTNGNVDTAVGKDAMMKSVKEYFNYLTETVANPQGETAAVSTTDRNHLILEKNMPEMYFYPTCRHGYKEAYARFDSNKAYFVKIKQIKFERNIHGVISDKNVYKFVPGDSVNNEHCDFILNKTTKTWTVQ
jgi:hypothetical protein